MILLEGYFERISRTAVMVNANFLVTSVRNVVIEDVSAPSTIPTSARSTVMTPDECVHPGRDVLNHRRALPEPRRVVLVPRHEVDHAPGAVNHVIQQVSIEVSQRLSLGEYTPGFRTTQTCLQSEAERAVIEERPILPIEAGIRRRVSMGVYEWHHHPPPLVDIDRRSARRRESIVAVVYEREVRRDVTRRGKTHQFLDVLGVERSERLVSALVFGR